MSSVLALPQFAVFKNKWNSKYLSYRKSDKFLVFNGDATTSQVSKFAIESASNGSGFVHVRCCYNNKYLVRNSSFVTAEAANPNEDTSMRTCTLFEPIPVSDGDRLTIRFRHVQSGMYACLFNSPADAIRNNSLCAQWTDPNTNMMDAYEVVNWNSLVIFPSHAVAFKGHNGSYLGAIWAESRNYQQYSVEDKNSDRAAFVVHPVGNGNVQVYCRYFTRYWSYNGWIWADRLQVSPTDPICTFTPIKLGDNVIAFRSLGNNRFLRGIDMDNKTRCLRAEEVALTAVTHITVEELVVSRNIYNVVYRQEDARIYNDHPIVCGTGLAQNNSDQEDTMSIPITYREAKSTSWENSISLSASVTSTVQVGVPLIADASIEFNVTVSGTHQWGGTVDESFETGITYIAKIAPRKQVRVSYVASIGTCDIPFSYTQEDLYSDGTRASNVHDDGLFTGVNCYNFSFIKDETDI